MNEVMVGIVGLVAVLAFFLTGIELAFAMALVGFWGFSSLVSVEAGLESLGQRLIQCLQFIWVYCCSLIYSYGADGLPCGNR